MSRSTIVLFALLLATTSRQLAAQARPETIRGRVTTDSGAAIAGATVSATMAPDRSYQQATTDVDGRFSIRFVAGTGDYLVHVSAVGFKAVRKRLLRAATDTALDVDFRLTSSVAQLTTVKVTSKKPRPDRGSDAAADVGAAEQQRDGVFASVAPDQDGSFAAIAAAVPGASASNDGLSVLGLGGSQSSATLNGMAFGGSGLPRDARTQVRVTTSTYDPSRGGFSGGQIAVELSPGTTFLQRNAHLTFDAPPLQSQTLAGGAPGRRFTAINGSIGGSGELVENVWYYNSALQIGRRTSDAPSLLTADAQQLATVGVAPDSVARLARIIAAQGIPIAPAGMPSLAISQSVSFVTRLDHAPYKPGTRDPSPSTWNATTYGNIVDNQAQGFTPTSVATRGGRRASLTAGSQLNYSRFFGDVLNDTRAAFSVNSDHGTPYLRLPGGTVLVSSMLPGGEGALSGLTFGGSAGEDYARRSWTWEMINETQWYTRGNPHRAKVTLESRLDRYAHSATGDALGSFVFPSLAALEAGQPSAFSRTVSSPARSGGEWSGYAAVGDYWRVTPSLQLLYGVRLEGNHYLTSLADNPAIDSAFGASTSVAPDAVHVSPRLGFTWFFGREAGGRPIRFNNFARQTLAPTMMLRGGIGEFRGLLPSTLLSDASVANGLPGAASQLTCIGPAAPIPQWTDYLADSSTLPGTCANGAPGTFSDAAPVVRLFDRSFAAARSWRANLAWSRTFRGLGLAIDGVYSLNLSQPGSVDLNFKDSPAFYLGDEGNRPVYVAATSIAPQSGTLSPVDARANGAFGPVISRRSDLRSTSRQITATITPQTFNRVYYSLSYTLGDVRGDTRGFDRTTFGSPLILERGPGELDIRHQVIVSFGSELPFGLNASVYGRFSSGLPYTPRIAGDVNGDGLANDRAFVFDPARAGDPSLASGMRTLLASAPNQASDCLMAQLNQPARWNSCRAPWTASVNARIGLYDRFGFTRRRFNAVLYVTNPASGLDQLIHGRDGMRGWGGGAMPDPTLLMVRGFDPATKQFRYEVNPRFGSTRWGQQLAQTPFRVTLDLAFDLGVPLVKQQANKLLTPGRRGRPGPRLPADSMIKRLKSQVPDLYAAVLAESDSLLITRDQAEALTAARAAYNGRADSLWRSVAITLVAMADDYDADSAMYLIDDATERAWLVARDELTVLEKILSPLQMRLAPFPVSALQRSVGKPRVGVRIFSF